MKEKRYAIVRVDDHCPEGLYENIKPNILCPKDGDCEKCRKKPCIKDILKILSKKEQNNGN